MFLVSPDKLGQLAAFYAEGSAVGTVRLMDDRDPAATLPEDVQIIPWRGVASHSDWPVPTPGTIETKFCEQRLPAYTVPEVIHLCDKLPKTSTGKVNRTLLFKRQEMAR